MLQKQIFKNIDRIPPIMNEFWEKVEKVNRKLIPYAIVVLLGVIIYELFFHVEDHTINLVVEILDGIVIGIFVIDLIFLAIKSKSTKFFFRHYWLDLLAIFPFTLFFNTINRIYRLLVVSERLAVGQALVHEGLEARKGLSAFARGEKLAAESTKLVGEGTRFVRFARFFRIGVRLLRVITKSGILPKLYTYFKSKHQKKTNTKKKVPPRQLKPKKK